MTVNDHSTTDETETTRGNTPCTTTSTTSTTSFICEFCQVPFTSRNLLFQHLRGNSNNNNNNNNKSSNKKKTNPNRKKSKPNHSNTNDDTTSIIAACQKIQQELQHHTTTTATTATTSASTTDDATTTTTTSSSTDDVMTSNNNNNNNIPLPPSIMKQQQRHIQRAQEQLLRKIQHHSHSPATNTTSSSLSSSSSMVWMGDLPLIWTTPQRNYQRLRMLLRAHVPRTIPIPYIKLVHRKAYRSRRSSRSSHTTNTSSSTSSSQQSPPHQTCPENSIDHTMTVTHDDDINDDDNNTDHERPVSMEMESIHDDAQQQQQQQQQQHNEPLKVSHHPNNSHNTNIHTNNHPYLGYAILVFRDDDECNVVLHELHQRTVTLSSVFSTTDDILQNKDFYDLMHGTTTTNNKTNATFQLKVRPVDPHHAIPKPRRTPPDLMMNDLLNDNVTVLPMLTNHTKISHPDHHSMIRIPPPNSCMVVVEQKDPPIMDRLRPLSTELLIQRIQSLGGDTSTLNTTISPETLFSFSPPNTNTTTSTTAVHQKSDPTAAAAVQRPPPPPPSLLTILQDQHDRALQHAVQMYENHVSPKIIHHEGRLIPNDLRDTLVSLLNNLRWAVPNHRSGMTTERYLVLLSNVQNDLFYNDIRNACKELMTTCTNDPSFYYSGIAITKNFVGSPHIDDRDQTYQYAISLGNFTNGGELCVDGGIQEVYAADHWTNTDNHHIDDVGSKHYDPTNTMSVPVIHVVNTHNRMARIDGRHVHWVRTWENQKRDEHESTNPSNSDRYSLIFYDTSNRCPTPVVDMSNFSVV